MGAWFQIPQDASKQVIGGPYSVSAATVGSMSDEYVGMAK
jgi:hypothetical protein